MSYIDNIRKVVPYVPGEQPQDKNIIKLNTNECPYPPSPRVIKAIEDMDVDRLRLYPDPAATDLVHTWAKYMGLKDEQVFVGVGSDDVLSMCFLTFFNSNKPVLFPDITYSFYDVWCDVYRIPYETIPLDDNFEWVLDDYTRRENGGIVIANPNAPTGVNRDIADIELIIKSNPDSIVIVDEAYVDFGGQTAVSLINKYDNVVIVQTFSKSRSLAGVRIGYAMACPELIKYLNDVKYSVNSYTMNYPSIVIGSAAIMDSAYFEDVTSRMINTRERSKKRLKGLGFTFPDSCANFIFAKHESVSGQRIFDELKAKKIYVRHWNKDRIGDYLRISVGTDEQMDSLFEALEDILK